MSWEKISYRRGCQLLRKQRAAAPPFSGCHRRDAITYPQPRARPKPGEVGDVIETAAAEHLGGHRRDAIVGRHCRAPLSDTIVGHHRRTPSSDAIVGCHRRMPLSGAIVGRHRRAPLSGAIVAPRGHRHTNATRPTSSDESCGRATSAAKAHPRKAAAKAAEADRSPAEHPGGEPRRGQPPSAAARAWIGHAGGVSPSTLRARTEP